MAFIIRNFSTADYSTLLQWWECAGSPPAALEMLPEQSTFIIEQNEIPLVSVTLYLNNSRMFSQVDNLIANPSISPELRREAVNELNEYIGLFAQSLGYKRLFCMSEKPALVERYRTLGYTPTLSGVTTMVWEL